MRGSIFIPLLIIWLLVQNTGAMAQESNEFINHIVKENENVFRISLQYNVHMDSIRRWNFLDSDFKVIEGMTLKIKIPLHVSQDLNKVSFSTGDTTSKIGNNVGFHFVKEKENVFRISLIYHVSPESIRVWSGLNSDYQIYVGQKLIVSRKLHEFFPEQKTNNHDLIQVPDTSVNFTRKTSTDSVVLSSNKGYLPLLSESVEVSNNLSFFGKVLNSYTLSNYLFKIVVLLNLFFILSVVTLLLMIFYRRLKSSYINFKKSNCLDRYRDFITDWLYKEQPQIVPLFLLVELKDRVNREVFTSELLSLHSNLTGDSADKLVELFHLTGLKKYSIRKASNSSWFIKAKGFRELAQMKIEEERGLISKYLNSSNSVLRIEAQMAWIQLNPNEPLSFLSNPNVKLTDWGLLNSLLALKKNDVVPDFGQWLSSLNKGVTLFAIKMSGVFKQFDNVEMVAMRLEDSDLDIRQEAIHALGEMALPSPGYKLRQLFPSEGLLNKKEIIRSLIMMSDSSNIPFFETVLLNEQDINLRILAAKAMVSFNGICDDTLNFMLRDADPLLTSIIIHAKDKRI